MPTGIAPTKDIRTQMTGSEQTVVAAILKRVLGALSRAAADPATAATEC